MKNRTLWMAILFAISGMVFPAFARTQYAFEMRDTWTLLLVDRQGNQATYRLPSFLDWWLIYDVDSYTMMWTHVVPMIVVYTLAFVVTVRFIQKQNLKQPQTHEHEEGYTYYAGSYIEHDRAHVPDDHRRFQPPPPA